MHIRKKAAAAAAVASTGALLAGTLVAPGVASAAGSIQKVTVTMSAKAVTFSTGNTIDAGRTKFTVVSKHGDRFLQLLQLANGYSVADAKSDVNKAFGGDTKAIKRIDTKITWFGGAEAVNPDTPGTFAETLAPGKYYAIDQNSDAFSKFTVADTAPSRGAIETTSTITAATSGHDNVFRTSDKTMPHRGWTLFRNRAAEPHFLVMQHVAKSTTHKDVQEYIDGGGQGTPSWSRDEFTQAGVISPDSKQQFHYALPKGRYLITCFWPSVDSGAPHFFMGMFKLVDLV